MNVKYSITKDGKSLAKSGTYLPRGKMFYDIKVLGSDDEIKSYIIPAQHHNNVDGIKNFLKE